MLNLNHIESYKEEHEFLEGLNVSKSSDLFEALQIDFQLFKKLVDGMFDNPSLLVENIHNLCYCVSNSQGLRNYLEVKYGAGYVQTIVNMKKFINDYERYNVDQLQTYFDQKIKSPIVSDSLLFSSN